MLIHCWPLQAAEGHAAIFMYHRFGEDKLPSTNIRMEQFRAQLDYLQKEKFHIWPLSQLVKTLQQGQTLPDKTVAITIDDAYRSVYEQAFPLMRARNIPFTVFVASDYIDKEYGNYMSWQQMREMRDAGVDFALHSAGHDHLVERQPNESATEWQQRVKNDLVKSQRRLREELDIDSDILAYPYGEYSNELEKVVAQLGWTAFGQHSGAVSYHSDLLALPRFPQSEYYGDLDQFITKANSLAMPVADLTPSDPLLASNQPPLLRVTLGAHMPRAAQLQCFVSGEGRVEVSWIESGKIFDVQGSKPIQSRRGRYNCTVPSEQAGRYYWFSQPWIIAGQPEK